MSHKIITAVLRSILDVPSSNIVLIKSFLRLHLQLKGAYSAVSLTNFISKSQSCDYLPPYRRHEEYGFP